MTSLRPELIGRYVYLHVHDVEYRVFYEESGTGIPVVLQHTAGADARQWRHLLEDEQLTKRFRFIALDLPYHGRSLPPSGLEWWKQDYVLTKNFAESITLEFCHELGLEHPAYIGCLLGGQLAIDLALDFPREFRAVVGIEATATSGGDENFRRYVYHPRVSNETKGALMLGVCSPKSPEASRHEVAWVYMQCAPPVMRGDLNYYMNEHDLTGRTNEFNTNTTSVFVMSSEYGSGSPGFSESLSNDIAGSTFIAMAELGNFPMTENYSAFRPHIATVLDEIEKRADD